MLLLQHCCCCYCCCHLFSSASTCVRYKETWRCTRTNTAFGRQMTVDRLVVFCALLYRCMWQPVTVGENSAIFFEKTLDGAADRVRSLSFINKTKNVNDFPAPARGSEGRRVVSEPTCGTRTPYPVPSRHASGAREREQNVCVCGGYLRTPSPTFSS